MAIFINEAISKDSSAKIVEEIFKLSNENETKRIVLVINSLGGSINALRAIIEALQISGKEIVTINISKASGAAAILFLEGKKRIMFKSSELIYEEQKRAFNNDILSYSEILSVSTEEQRNFNFMIDELTKVSSLSRNSIEDRIFPNKRFIVTANEALDLCIATKICDNSNDFLS